MEETLITLILILSIVNVVLGFIDLYKHKEKRFFDRLELPKIKKEKIKPIVRDDEYFAKKERDELGS